MKKIGWSLAVASMVLLTGQALAEGRAGEGTGGFSESPEKTTPNGLGTGAGTMESGSATSAQGGQSLQGKVESFDRTNNTLMLSGSEKTLKVDSSTKVMKQGSRATLDDIKEGDQVRASYSGSGETLQVKSLDILSTGSTGSEMGAPQEKGESGY
jgi:hypothetical protein